MYIVGWDDCEGNHHEMTFDSFDDAKMEADALSEKYDGVKLKW